ncbi:acetyl-CoA carboxylase biotin carboxyl carrier protein subunit [Bradyrhizobium sp. CIR3A]|uniref:acetyl-CoA carboxylase biotin carboxyl carrier protein subunit n=1 Tax=Bradyrhizobium sp. CIR3A TaxID=2663838 RepID=UPI0016060F8E|nr:acetyl-CoA carboxylase biotin carboxyl carrier protein subunit [Bradyrhizobium sp. CIR3A]MBB4258057.1 acetyl-CoA carboxylase biotin carboxyl carrier protein [Bradyrhizobium sp. CIR3A]
MSNPLDHVDQLSVWLKDAGIVLLEMRGPSATFRLVNDGASVRVVAGEESPSVDAPSMTVRAQSPGIFLDRHPFHEHAIALTDSNVRAGEPLGFLQIGPLLLAVPAPRSGTVTDMLIDYGTIVGYGTPLFLLRPIEGEAS